MSRPAVPKANAGMRKHEAQHFPRSSNHIDKRLRRG
jgi:hypothetical protein